MKKPDHTTISDLLSLGESALSVLLGATSEAKGHAQSARDSFVRKLDLVTRDEFDAAFAMIKKARQMQDDLHKRLTVMEKKLSVSSPQKKPVKKTISRSK